MADIDKKLDFSIHLGLLLTPLLDELKDVSDGNLG